MTERKSNFELLRIICMLFIVGGHLIAVHSSEKGFSSSDWLIDMSTRGFFSVAVDTFIIISGYWSIKLRAERLIRLELQTLFYSMSILLVLLAIGNYSLNPIKDLKYFLPFTCNLYWFVSNYMVLCLLAPLLNHFAQNISTIRFRQLLTYSFLFLYIWPTFCFLINAEQFIGDAGYGIINFSYLYLLGRYLRMHYKICHSVSFYFSAYMISGVLLAITQLGLSYVLGFEFTSFYSYNSVFIIAGAVMLFLTFARMEFSSRVINWLAAPCLSVYLIHSHPLIFNMLGETFRQFHLHGINYFIALVVLPVVIYLACIMIERIRLLFLKDVEQSISQNISDALRMLVSYNMLK